MKLAWLDEQLRERCVTGAVLDGARSEAERAAISTLVGLVVHSETLGALRKFQVVQATLTSEELRLSAREANMRTQLLSRNGEIVVPSINATPAAFDQTAALLVHDLTINGRSLHRAAK